jgi:hypothetical protein
LLQAREDGVFLIRDSVHFLGDYTLSVCCDKRVDHYRILTRGNHLEVDGGECTFDSLMSLVEVIGHVTECSRYAPQFYERSFSHVIISSAVYLFIFCLYLCSENFCFVMCISSFICGVVSMRYFKNYK